MSKVKVILDKKGVKTEILQADWMRSYIESVAQQKANTDTHIKSFIGFDRAKSIIYPNTREHES